MIVIDTANRDFHQRLSTDLGYLFPAAVQDRYHQETAEAMLRPALEWVLASSGLKIDGPAHRDALAPLPAAMERFRRGDYGGARFEFEGRYGADFQGLQAGAAATVLDGIIATQNGDVRDAAAAARRAAGTVATLALPGKVAWAGQSSQAVQDAYNAAAHLVAVEQRNVLRALAWRVADYREAGVHDWPEEMERAADEIGVELIRASLDRLDGAKKSRAIVDALKNRQPNPAGSRCPVCNGITVGVWSTVGVCSDCGTGRGL